MDIAFVDVETTGLDPQVHEVIEIGVIRVEPIALRILASHEVKIRPTRLEVAEPSALAINGYSDEAWSDAVELDEGLRQIAPFLEDTMLAGHNVVSFDEPFLWKAFACAGLAPPATDYHRLDTASLGWLAADPDGGSVSLRAVCEALGIDRPVAHRALADAVASLEVARHTRRLFRCEELTLLEVASRLRISEKTAYVMAREGRLPAFRVGAQWRMRRSDLDRWIDEQRTQPVLVTSSVTATALAQLKAQLEQVSSCLDGLEAKAGVR